VRGGDEIWGWLKRRLEWSAIDVAWIRWMKVDEMGVVNGGWMRGGRGGWDE